MLLKRANTAHVTCAVFFQISVIIYSGPKSNEVTFFVLTVHVY